ncbi:hypothetical protein Y032_0019g3815 [Ancylostoma ceylanicum]|uniref:Uncharacterized protein n=1 Tax=Ancylostoma ceylanicum TaxID=53326 RepID=A0A016V2F8_9BILA|nr:hypothetical protein Y032_0019g3815 [Ancylostoma ceylanicum]
MEVARTRNAVELNRYRTSVHTAKRFRPGWRRRSKESSKGSRARVTTHLPLYCQLVRARPITYDVLHNK